MTKAEMIRIIQERYREDHREYKDALKTRSLNPEHYARRLAHLTEVHYIANLMGIELPELQAEAQPQKKENG